MWYRVLCLLKAKRDLGEGDFLVFMNNPVVVEQTPLEARIRSIVEPVLMHQGLELVLVKLSGGRNGLQVGLYVGHQDTDVLVTLEELEKASRLLGDLLDVHDAQERLFPSSYTLEVSSPGLERPLSKKPHFESVIGKRIAFKTMGGDVPKQGKGTLEKVLDEGVEIVLDGASKPIWFPFAVMKQAHLLVDPFAKDTSKKQAQKPKK